MITSIIITAVVSSAFGSLWFSPRVFGRRWMELTGIDAATIKSVGKAKMARSYGLNFLGEIAIAWVLSILIFRLSIETAPGAIEIALKAWLGFMLPIMLASHIWENKNAGILVITGLYRGISIVLMAIVLTSL
jgi:hypothetical protein